MGLFMNMLNLRFKRVEQLTGLSEKQIKNLSPEEYRTYLEKRSGKQLRIISEFPTIGRENIYGTDDNPEKYCLIYIR